MCVGSGLACQVSVFRRYGFGAESEFSTSSVTSAIPFCRFRVVLRGAKGSLKGVKCLGVKYNSNRKLRGWQGGDERGRAGSVGMFRNVFGLSEYSLYSSCQSRVYL